MSVCPFRSLDMVTVHSSSRARYGTGDVQVVPAPRLHVTRQHESACKVNRAPGASAARAHAPAGGAWPGRGLTPAVPRREDRWRAARVAILRSKYVDCALLVACVDTGR